MCVRITRQGRPWKDAQHRAAPSSFWHLASYHPTFHWYSSAQWLTSRISIVSWCKRSCYSYLHTKVTYGHLNNGSSKHALTTAGVLPAATSCLPPLAQGFLGDLRVLCLERIGRDCVYAHNPFQCFAIFASLKGNEGVLSVELPSFFTSHEEACPKWFKVYVSGFGLDLYNIFHSLTQTFSCLSLPVSWKHMRCMHTVCTVLCIKSIFKSKSCA